MPHLPTVIPWQLLKHKAALAKLQLSKIQGRGENRAKVILKVINKVIVADTALV